MDSWKGNLRGFVSRPESSFSFVNHHNCDDPFPGMEITKHRAMAETRGGMEKKKRLESDQLESLERSFDEEIKLDPKRKMKLSRELGLQPRQIAVWFQNRRARWKTRQLQRLYDVLRHEYAVIYREKQKLQDEVLKLKAILREEVKVSTVYAEISGSSRVREASHHRMIDEGSYVFNVNEYNASVLPTCWGVLPSCPPC